MCEVYNLLLKELLEFQAKIAYFTDEETQAKRYKVLNIMKWNIFRNLHDFHRSTSKRYYFGGSISQQCVSVLTQWFSYCCIQNPVGPERRLRNHREGGKREGCSGR